MGGQASPLNREQIVDAVVELVSTGLIPVEEFIRAYNQHRSITSQAPRFAVLDVENNGELAAVPVAVRRALDDGFFVALWTSVLDRLIGPVTQDARLDAITKAIGAQTAGVMQKVLRVAGLRSVSSVPSLLRAARATGLITAKAPGEASEEFGTGFLVTPRLMLTAAHVVESLIENARERPGSDTRATIRFENQLEGPGEWPVKARLAPNWLVALSPPNGIRGELAVTPAAEAASKLDFALIRLSEPVGHITGVVDITDPPEPEVPGRLTVIGYGGGTESVFDDHVVLAAEPETCRVRHGANTVAGMSGGPCLDSAGRAVALHEGSITNVNPNYNRAVQLRAVRRWMRQNGVDPLLGDSGPLWGVHDREARRAWIAAGESRPGITEAERAEWLESVAPFNPDDPRGSVSSDIFHPVFGMEDFQDWIQEARLENSTRRLALLSGLPGSGKSFSATILRNCLEGLRHRITVVPPSMIVNRTIVDTLDFILAEAGVRPRVAVEEGPRPMAGVLRRDLFPDTLGDLGKAIAARSGPAGVLWLFVDVGDDSAFTADTSREWKQFLIEAEKHSWLRVVMVGMSNSRRGEFKTSVGRPDQVLSKSLAPITADEFLKSVQGLAEASRVDQDHWTQTSSLLWDDLVEPLSTPQGRSTVAVRALLEIRALMQAESGEGTDV